MAVGRGRRALVARAGGRLLWALGPALMASLALWGLVAAARTAPLTDDAPDVATVFPPPNATDVPSNAALDGSLLITFTEPVTLTSPAVEVDCTRSGTHALRGAGGPVVFTFSSATPFWPAEQCTPRVFASAVHDVDDDDPPDSMVLDAYWTFTTAGQGVLINEVDAVSAGGEADFVELIDDGTGWTDLKGLTLVFYGGQETAVYYAQGLDGHQTDGGGFFVLGAVGMAGVDLPMAADSLRDGPDAVALYAAPETEFPRNAPLTTTALIDAVVYGPAGAELLALLWPGEAALDEDARGAALTDSIQRCPNGRGRPRSSTPFLANRATPDQPNQCRTDEAPQVIAVMPAPDAQDVADDTVITVEFSESVQFHFAPLIISCSKSGAHAYTIAGGDTLFRFTSEHHFAGGDECELTLDLEAIGDLDENDPPDKMADSTRWRFTVAPAVDTGIVINEVDADTPGEDAAEFIELYDGGRGGVALDGLALVLFNGVDDRANYAIDLDGQATDAAGYLLLGSPALGASVTLPNGTLQNGPDAVALLAGDAGDFPDGTPVTATLPIDALVYGRATTPDEGLLPLLEAGQPQVDEGERGAADDHSNQRCPNGAGGARNTAGYKQNTPTPGTTNDCLTDRPPQVVARQPARGASGASVYTTLTIGFDEPVKTRGKWVTLKCEESGEQLLATTGGPTDFTLTAAAPLHYGESCRVNVVAAQVTDRDSDDPPDAMTGNEAWSFTTAQPPPDFLVINEIDSDTPSYDVAEFIEFFDGGAGHTTLDGLAVVFFNGYDYLAYRAFDLDGLATDERGYLTLGNAAVMPDLVFSDGLLQNGPDAVALYAGDAADFPSGAPVRLAGLLDAVVYGVPSDAPAELLQLLVAGQSVVDEGGRGAANDHSLQRCPNGAGGQRQTTAFLPSAPTPGEPSNCVTDTAPQVEATTPRAGEIDVSVYSQPTVTFDEPVTLPSAAVVLRCLTTGERPASVSSGPEAFRIEPLDSLPFHDTCRLTLNAQLISDLDIQDPPDHPAADFEWSFITGAPPPDFIRINEVDSDTPGSDTAEFIELFDGGLGETELTGLIVVLYNGSDDRSYLALDLSDVRTDSNGFLVIGNDGVAGVAVTLPTGSLQNGADAVALFAGDISEFPDGTGIETRGLVDALVYGTADASDQGLLGLLAEGQDQVDEAGWGISDVHSSGRCPDGAGGPRYTSTYRAAAPTPGMPNSCVDDAPPAVASVFPSDEATGVAADAILTVTFDEDVTVDADWGNVSCAASGEHEAVTGGGPRTFSLAPILPFSRGESCTIDLRAAAIHDLDIDDPPDSPTADYGWAFTIANPPPPPDHILINEVDADTPGSDTAEFIELYDGGIGHTDLTGLFIVLWNGQNDALLRSIALDGHQTDADGYFVLGNAGLPADLTIAKGTLQNGPDAIGLYAGPLVNEDAGAPVTTEGLIDAIVYGPGDETDVGLLPLLASGQQQRDEGERGAAENHSLQRCPNGAGNPRETVAYEASLPSPGATNPCLVADNPPVVVSTLPSDETTGVDPTTGLVITFSEDVAPEADWVDVNCDGSGTHEVTSSGGPREFALQLDAPLAANDRCEVTVLAARVHDSDTDDPPDAMVADFTWRFYVREVEPPMVLINELDADTPGKDRAEFIELYDGGIGHSDLSGLVVVFWNGKDDTAYRAINLSGYETDSAGYFVLGNTSVQPGLSFTTGALQNGPDAVAIYAGRAEQFGPGTGLTLQGLRDAVVYGPAATPDGGLLALLESDEPQVDEAAAGDAEAHSLQRCPDGAGGPRRSAAIGAAEPTLGRANTCATDEPPAVVAVRPAPESAGVPLTTTITITFSEAVHLAEAWYALTCTLSGDHTATVGGGPLVYELAPQSSLASDEDCGMTINAAAVHDLDAAPPAAMAADYTWSFQLAPAVAAPTAAFTATTPVYIGQSVVFTNTTTGPGALTYQWDFGDHSPPSTATHPTHRYHAVGVYTVTLAAANSAATTIHTAVVAVRPRPVLLPVVAR